MNDSLGRKGEQYVGTFQREGDRVKMEEDWKDVSTVTECQRLPETINN